MAKRILPIILVIACLVLLYFFVTSSVMTKQSPREQKIQAVEDAIDDYFETKRFGNPRTQASKAAVVARAYKSAGDQQSYWRWVRIQRQDAYAAGLDTNANVD